RTQQVIGFESGAAATPDPLAGSFYVETLTDAMETAARDLIAEIDALGGAVAAIEAGVFQDRIAASAYRAQLAIESGEQVVVGVTRFPAAGDEAAPELLGVSDAIRDQQSARLRALRDARDDARWTAAMEAVERAARGDENLLPHVLEAVEA